MSRLSEKMDSARTAAASAPSAPGGASSASRRVQEWQHLGVLELAPGLHSDRVRHLVLQAYATRGRTATAVAGARVVLLDDEARNLGRACYPLPLCRPDLWELIFDEHATFAEAPAWPASRLAALEEKGTAARLHVLEAAGDVHPSVEWTRPEDAEGGALAAAARFLDLEKAELVLLVQGARYQVGIAWLERAP